MIKPAEFNTSLNETDRNMDQALLEGDHDEEARMSERLQERTQSIEGT